MKKLIIFVFLSIIGNAQKIKTVEVLKVSDSLILKYTNFEISNFFKISEGSYYIYLKDQNQKTGKFLDKKKLNRNTAQIWILYNFRYPKIAGIEGRTWIKLDKNLKLIEPISLEFIPNFIWENEGSNLISKDLAKEIAVKNFQKTGIKIDEPELLFDDKINSYIYMVINKLNEHINSQNQPAGNTEVIKINAKTGQIVEKFDGYYGLIIR